MMKKNYYSELEVQKIQKEISEQIEQLEEENKMLRDSSAINNLTPLGEQRYKEVKEILHKLKIGSFGITCDLFKREMEERRMKNVFKESHEEPPKKVPIPRRPKVDLEDFLGGENMERDKLKYSIATLELRLIKSMEKQGFSSYLYEYMGPNKKYISDMEKRHETWTRLKLSQYYQEIRGIIRQNSANHKEWKESCDLIDRNSAEDFENWKRKRDLEGLHIPQDLVLTAYLSGIILNRKSFVTITF